MRSTVQLTSQNDVWGRVWYNHQRHADLCLFSCLLSQSIWQETNHHPFSKTCISWRQVVHSTRSLPWTGKVRKCNKWNTVIHSILWKTFQHIAHTLTKANIFVHSFNGIHISKFPYTLKMNIFTDLDGLYHPIPHQNYAIVTFMQSISPSWPMLWKAVIQSSSRVRVSRKF